MNSPREGFCKLCYVEDGTFDAEDSDESDCDDELAATNAQLASTKAELAAANAKLAAWSELATVLELPGDLLLQFEPRPARYILID